MFTPFDVVAFVREQLAAEFAQLGLSVRQAWEHDRAAFEGLNTRVGPERPAKSSPHFEEWVGRLFRGESGIAILIEDASGVVLGTAGMCIVPMQLEDSDEEGLCGWLVGLALDESVRGRGFSSRLMEGLLIFGMSRGVMAFLLETRNPLVSGMSTRRGFQVVQFPEAGSSSDIQTLMANPQRVGTVLMRRYRNLRIVIVPPAF